MLSYYFFYFIHYCSFTCHLKTIDGNCLSMSHVIIAGLASDNVASILNGILTPKLSPVRPRWFAQWLEY